MDPVNPAPAGNPQLTTHLLVSHKKNKNFHPSKVSLKRVNIITKEIPLLRKPVPHVLNFMSSQKWRFAKHKGKLRVAETLQQEIELSEWLRWGIKDQPCTILLDIRWTETVEIKREVVGGDEGGEPSVDHTFKDLKFTLKFLDWDDTVVTELTELDVCQASFHDDFQMWVSWSPKSDMLLVNSLSLKISWNQMSIKLGDSQSYETPNDQPSDSLSKSNASFLERNPSFLRISLLKDFLPSEDQHLDTYDRSNLYFSVARPQIRLSRYLEFLCNQVRAEGSLSSKLQSLMQEIVCQKVYLIEPVIVAIVRPMLDEKDQLIYRELGLKMVDFFQKLKTLRTLDTITSVSILDSCLYFDWQDMLKLFAESNNESFNKHLKVLVTASDATNQELKNRPYDNGRFEHLDFVLSILHDIPRAKAVEKFDYQNPFILIGLSKYLCWRNGMEDAMVVGFIPEQFTGGEESILSPPYKMIKLGFPDCYLNAKIVQDILMLIGPENTLYLLDLRAVMKGPEEQSLEHAAICSIQLLTDSEDQQSDPYQFLLEENSVCSLTWSIHDLEMTAKIIFYSLRSKVNQKEVTKLRGSELFQIEKLISDCFSCKILPNDTLAIGYYCKQEAVAQEHPKGRIIRLMLLQYERISNQLRQVSDETYPIDDLYLSQLPQFLDSFREQSLSFVEHKKKVFCVASLHMEKQVKQIFCLHRHRFIPIGGTNCNRPGLYVMKRNTISICTTLYENLGQPLGFRWSGHIDLRKEVMVSKYCDWSLNF